MAAMVGPALPFLSMGLTLTQQLLQMQAQEAAYAQRRDYDAQAAKLERQRRERARHEAQTRYEASSQALAERTQRQRSRTLLEFDRDERERLRQLRLGNAAAVADAAGRGILGGGSAAAIQRGLESRANALAGDAEAHRAEVARQLEYDTALNAYDLGRERYLTMAGLHDSAQQSALDRAYARQQNLLTLTEQRARARLGLANTFLGTLGQLDI